MPIRMTTDADGRRLYYDDATEELVHVPSVTVILDYLSKPGLDKWKEEQAAEKALNTLDDNNLTKVLTTVKHRKIHAKASVGAHRDYSKKHANIGTRFHAVKNRPIESLKNEDPMVLTAIHSWHRFLEDFGQPWKKAYSEVMIMGSINDFGYGGTLDMVYEMNDGRVLLIELKTAKRIYDINALQAAAYAHAYHAKVDDVWVMRLGKEAVEYEVLEVNVSRSLELFNYLIQLYYAFEMKSWSGVWDERF